MRETASLSPSPKPCAPRPVRWISAARAALALPTAALVAFTGLVGTPSASALSSVGLGSSEQGSSNLPDRNVQKTTYPEVEGLPAGVEVERVEWLNNHRVAVFIESAAMPDKLQQVQILLARDWYKDPNRTFAEVWALDGMRARDDHNGWTEFTNIEQQFADRNVNVILPVGGQSSFYTDWQEPDNGTHYKWETFLTQELVPILDKEFRSNKKRAVIGLSMGGTAAMNLAHRNPYLFDFVGSFSGYLDTTTPGMPEAITAAQIDAGGYNSQKMWGPLYSQEWINHDPKLGLEDLKGKSIYVSAGNGQPDYGQPNSVAREPASAAGMGLEVIARMSTQTFVNRAKRAGLHVESRFRPSGVHTWEYWQFELSEAWPFMAESLGLSQEDRGADCTPIGAIATATENGIIGSCVNNEYPVGAGGIGRAQDFRAGVAYWSPTTGAHAIYGAIGARYSQLGGPSSWLGFPTTGERPTTDGSGRYVHFENGSIFWSKETGAYAIPKDLFERWGEDGWESSRIGYPTGPANEISGGVVQAFERGWMTRSSSGEVHMVYGAIAEKYGSIDTAKSQLGYPTSAEKNTEGGRYQEFEKGHIYWSPETGAHFIRFGDLFDYWSNHRAEFGLPTSDFADIPAGGVTQDFQKGSLRQINGVVQKG